MASQGKKGLIARKFVPGTMLLGLALSAGGVLILVLFATVIPVMPMLVLIGAMLAVPVGVLVALSAFDHQCLRCAVPLKMKILTVPAAAKARLKTAVGAGNVQAIAQLAERGNSASLNAIQVKCAYCPTCESVARLKVAGWPPQVIQGEDVEHLAALGQK